MAAASPPSDLIVKFDTPSNQDTIYTLTAGTLDAARTGIAFNLQIVEKGDDNLETDGISSTVIGSTSDRINTTTSQELANLISKYFSDKSILQPATAASGTGRNIRSMKLIVNVDPNA